MSILCIRPFIALRVHRNFFRVHKAKKEVENDVAMSTVKFTNRHGKPPHYR